MFLVFSIARLADAEPIQEATTSDYDLAIELARFLSEDLDCAIMVAKNCDGKACITDLVFPEHPADFLESIQ